MQSCGADLSWWLIFFVIVSSGAFGGWGRYHWDRIDVNGKCRAHLASYIVIGIIASLVVPLFLNTISSNLIKEATTDNLKLFTLIGFCLMASVFARRFIDSLAKKAFDLSNEAKEMAARAESNSLKADNRAIAMYHPLKLIEDGSYKDALTELNSVVGGDAANSEAWAWIAYCHKRLGNLSLAITAIQNALKYEGAPIFTWYYNLACYQSLAKSPVSEVVFSLEKAVECATQSQLAELVTELATDVDFAEVRADTAFQALMTRIGSR